MIDDSFFKGLITALGIGLMIGVVRERRHAPNEAEAGIRTHALVAILGTTTWYLGLIPFTATLLIIGAFVVLSYLRTSSRDPGLTGEVTVIITFTLSAMAFERIAIAAGLAVLCAILIQAKNSIHRIGRDLISEQEVGDSLLLLASALIVMPLLPDEPIDKWGVVNLKTIWKIVVLIMATGMFGHIARRALGYKLGLPLAGFFSGFVSSTAAIASFGDKVKRDPNYLVPSSAAALLANLSSLLIFIGVIATVSNDLFQLMIIPFITATLTLLIVVIVLLSHYIKANEDAAPPSGKFFKLSHAVIIAIAITSVSFLSAWLNESIGGVGVIVTCIIAAMAEIHASAATLAQLTSKEVISLDMAQWGVIGALVSSSFAKIVLSYFSGGKSYSLRVAIGLILMLLGATIGVIIT